MEKFLFLGASSEVCIEFIKNHSWQVDDEIFAQYYKNNSALSELQNKIPAKMKLFQADFNSEVDTKNFADCIDAENFVPTHILHASAVPVENRRFNELEWQDFQSQLNVQCRALVMILKNLIKPMAKAKTGNIVLILSSYTLNVPPKFLAEYVTAKYALMGLGKALAAEYAAKNIKVNMISPSMMETKFLTNIHGLIAEQNAANNPLKRNAAPSDIVKLIEFLFSAENTFVTGANIPVTGGENF